VTLGITGPGEALSPTAGSWSVSISVAGDRPQGDEQTKTHKDKANENLCTGDGNPLAYAVALANAYTQALEWIRVTRCLNPPLRAGSGAAASIKEGRLE
jgi:hypothetical protein